MLPSPRRLVFSACCFVLAVLTVAQAQNRLNDRFDEEAAERAREANLKSAPSVANSEQSASPHFESVTLRSFVWSAAAQPANEISGAAEHSASTLTAAETATSPVVRTFPGPLAGSTPPDPMIAAGPVNVMALTNGQYAVYDKSGKLLSSMQPFQFFTGQFIDNTFFWDGRILFDQNTQRFVVVSAAGDQRTHGSAYLAVSATSDATGRWNVFELLHSTQYWVDYPGLGVTSNSVFIPLFRNPLAGTPGAGLCPLLVIGMPELLAGSSNLNVTQFDQALPGCPGSAGPVLNFTAGTTGYLLAQATGNDNGNMLRLLTLDTSAKPTLSITTIPIPHYDIAEPPPQPGSTKIVRPITDIYSAVFRNGSIWTVQSVNPNDGNSSGVRWYEIDPNAKTVRQSGTITGAGNAYTGAITVLPNNDVYLVYTTSSDKQFASGGYAYRSSSDPPGTMTATGIYQAGSGTYSIQRWGDFAAISADPDGQSAWGIVEYVSANQTSGTAIVQLAKPGQTPPGSPALSLATSPSAATVKAGSSAQFAIAVTGQNLTAPITFACSGLPNGAACSFNPASLATPGSTTLTITTSASSAAVVPLGPLSWTLAAAALGIAGLCFIPSFGEGTFSRRKRRLALIVIGVALWFVACGGGGSHDGSANTPTSPGTTSTGSPGGSTTGGNPPTPPPPTPPPSTPPAQSFPITITATSGTTQATTGVTLTVQ
jgi:hypothetical protein